MSASSSSSFLASDWSYPRTAAAFTGYVGNPARDGQGGPSGALALCVANTPIPCKLEGMASQKFVQFTVINIRKKGWSYAPWSVVPPSRLVLLLLAKTNAQHHAHRKRQTGKNAKSAKDENTKELFENGEWARNDVTTERVGSSVLMYSFIKRASAWTRPSARSRRGRRSGSGCRTSCEFSFFPPACLIAHLTLAAPKKGTRRRRVMRRATCSRRTWT